MFPEKNAEITKKNLSMLAQQMSVNVFFFSMNSKEEKAFFGFLSFYLIEQVEFSGSY